MSEQTAAPPVAAGADQMDAARTASPPYDPAAKIAPNRDLLCTICGKRACSEP